MVESEVLLPEFGHAGDLQPRLALQALDVLEGGVQHQVDLARGQGRQPRGVALDDDELHFRDVAVARVGAAPPACVALQHGADVGLVAGELVRAGAVGVADRERFLLAVVVLGLLHAVALAPGLAHDGDVLQLLRQHGVGRLQQHVHGERVHHPRAGDALELEGALRVATQRPLDREDHVVGRHRAAVVETHLGPQPETPAARLRLLPGRGQCRFEPELRVAPDQRFIHLVGHARVVQQRDGVRVLRLGVEGAGDAQGLGRNGAAGQGQQQDETSDHAVLRSRTARAASRKSFRMGCPSSCSSCRRPSAMNSGCHCMPNT